MLTFMEISQSFVSNQLYAISLVNADWSPWTKWTDCSKTCDSGIRTRSRTCDNPPPANGGMFCIGNNVTVDVCRHSIKCPGK